MKRILWILVLISATPLLAQPAGVSVSLVAQASSTQNVGLPVVLTASVRTPGYAVLLPGGGGVLYETGRLRYAFKAHRSWPPCAAVSKTLREDVIAPGSESNPAYVTHIAQYIWTPSAADAGEYTFSVDVTYLPAPSRGMVPPTIVVRPQWMGTASTPATTTLSPTQTVGNNVNTTFYPSSPTPAPVNLTLTASVPTGPEFSWYRCTYTCSGFNPPTQTKSGVSVSFQIQIPNPGSYITSMIVDRVQQAPGQSSCIWQARTYFPHLSPAYYYVTAP